jgi:uncharacterized HAD superfamily protein
LKKIIGVDIDNVIAATDEKIRELIELFCGVSSQQKDIRSWYYSTSIGITKEQEHYVLERLHNQYISELKLINGAKKSLDVISSEYSIWLLTGRPNSTKDLTVKWLQEKAIPYDELFFVENKTVFADTVTFIVEDKAETALDFSSLGVRAYLFDYPWNRTVSNSLIVRVLGWHHLLSVLKIRSSHRHNHHERVLNNYC